MELDVHNYRVVRHTAHSTVFFGIRWVNEESDGTFTAHPEDEIPAATSEDELAAIVKGMDHALTLPVIDIDTGKEIFK